MTQPILQITTPQDLKSHAKKLKSQGQVIALVPTMGALHEGHLSLIDMARHHSPNAAIIVSIFVNPSQFGPNEDFDAYPRLLADDLEKLNTKGVDAVYTPDMRDIYPDGFATTVQVAGLSKNWCGATRPGHFDGVATIVTKLLRQSLCDIAIFGEKDYQQLQIIRRLNADLDLDVEIIGAPVMRDGNGLALSSRNRYLSETDYQIAIQLNKILEETAQSYQNGHPPADCTAKATRRLQEAGFTKIDYCAIINPETLEPVQDHIKHARILAAAHIGTTRLIDNMPA